MEPRSLDSLRALPFFLTIITLMLFGQAQVDGNELPPMTRIEINTFQDLLYDKEHCKRQMEDLEAEHGSDGWQQHYSGECRYVDVFTIQNLTADEIYHWIEWSNADSRAVNMFIDEETGLSSAALKILIQNITSVDYGLNSERSAALALIGEAYFKREGKLDNLTVADLQEFGAHAVYLLPPRYFETMSEEVFDHVLDLYDAETEKARVYYDLKNAAEAQNQAFNEPINFTMGAVYGHMIWVDEDRIRVLCREAFARYGDFDNLTEAELNRVRGLMQCAPPAECDDLPNNWVQSNVDILSDLPFNCHHDRTTTDWFIRSSAAFPTGNICGQFVAKKAIEGGDNPVVLSSQEDIQRMKGLILCIPDSYAKTAIDAAGCEMAKTAALQGYLKPAFKMYTIGNCIQLPSNMSTLNCSYIADTFGPYLSVMKNSFFKSLPADTLCNADCLSTFKSVKEMPKYVKKYVTKTCFVDSDVAIDSTAVDNLGAMVTDLSPEKFEEVDAADLERNLEAIKTDMASASVKENSQRYAVIQKLGTKMMESGKLSSIADSKEIMQEVSVKYLESKLTDVDADLGLDDPNAVVDLSDSQNKLVMEMIKKTKKPSNFSVEEIKAKKSVVKGFLISDITEISEYQNQQSVPSHMDIAKTLCEQTGWPLGPLHTINRKLIKQALILENDTVPFGHLSKADADSIDCECLMDFKGSEIMQMSMVTCSSVCSKIGYCDRFRCMTPNHRREVLSACMVCLHINGTVMSYSDIDKLGPNLISQLTKEELTQYVPGSVVKRKLHELKHMCMDQEFRAAVSGALATHLGNDGAALDEVVLKELGSAIMLFPESVQEQMNKDVIVSIGADIMNSITPKDDAGKELIECCQQWLTPGDIQALKLQESTLMKTLASAVLASKRSARKKRSSDPLTCDDIRLLGEAFTTVSDDEINSVEAAEFTECLSDIGELDGWNATQKELLLVKTLASLNTTVCNMTADEVAQLGAISQALYGSDLACLPYDDTDVVSSIGSLSGWNATQLASIATAYLDAQNLTDLENISVSDVALLGEILCGFTPTNIETLTVAVVAGSGAQLGRLEDCSDAQYTALKSITLDPAAYGSVGAWTAADVTELKYVLVGLTSAEIKTLTTDAIEGLAAEVIAELPVPVFAAMTNTQLQALISSQVSMVTDEQKAALSAEQIEILRNATGGYFTGTNDTNGTSDDTDSDKTPSEARALTTAAVWIIAVSALMLIVI